MSYLRRKWGLVKWIAPEVQLSLLKEEAELGTARVDCGCYKFDPMLAKVEFPDGFCDFASPFKECEFMDNPGNCSLLNS